MTRPSDRERGAGCGTGRLLEAQRAASEVVGGFGQLLTVSAAGMETKLVARWDQVVGYATGDGVHPLSELQVLAATAMTTL